MVDTSQSSSSILTAFADNTTGAITAQSMRNFVKSVPNFLDMGTPVVGQVIFVSAVASGIPTLLYETLGSAAFNSSSDFKSASYIPSTPTLDQAAATGAFSGNVSQGVGNFSSMAVGGTLNINSINASSGNLNLHAPGYVTIGNFQVDGNGQVDNCRGIASVGSVIVQQGAFVVQQYGTGATLGQMDASGNVSTPSLNVSGGATVGGNATIKGGTIYLGSNGNYSGRIYSADPSGNGPISLDSTNGLSITSLVLSNANAAIIGNNGMSLTTGNNFPLTIKGSGPTVLGATSTSLTGSVIDMALPTTFRQPPTGPSFNTGTTPPTAANQWAFNASNNQLIRSNTAGTAWVTIG